MDDLIDRHRETLLDLALDIVELNCLRAITRRNKPAFHVEDSYAQCPHFFSGRFRLFSSLSPRWRVRSKSLSLRARIRRFLMIIGKMAFAAHNGTTFVAVAGRFATQPGHEKNACLRSIRVLRPTIDHKRRTKEFISRRQAGFPRRQ